MFSRCRTYLCWFSLFLASQCVFALSSSHQAQASTPYFPHFWIAGVANSDQITRVEVAILQPLFIRETALAYLGLHAIQYDPAQVSWVMGAGIGYRYRANQYQQGAYVFLERYTSLLKNVFWMINPGVEWSTHCWQWQANAYFPVGLKLQQTENTVWGHEVGIQTHHYFKVHTEYDAQYACRESQRWSVDLKLTRHFSHFSFWLGGYYLERSKFLDSGFMAGLDYKTKADVHMRVQYRYDVVHRHVIEFRIQLDSSRFSGAEPHDFTQPVERHFASQWINTEMNLKPQVDKDQSPTNKGDEKEPLTVLKPVFMDNIFFFRADDIHASDPITEESCTWEHPCSVEQFTQTTLDFVQKKRPNTHFFLAEGVPYGNGQILHLHSGQSLYGRCYDFTNIPAFSNRPKFIGALALSSATRLEHIEVLNNQHQTMGIRIFDSNGVLLKNVSINSIEKNSLKYKYAVFIKNSRHVLMDNIYIQIADVDEREGGRGIYLEDSHEITLQNSSIILRDQDKPVWGIYLRGGSLIALNNDLAVHSDRDRALGIEISQGAHLRFIENRVKVQGNAVGKAFSQEGVGLFLYRGNPTVEAIRNHFEIITTSHNANTVIVGVERNSGRLTLRENHFELYGPLGGAKIRLTIPKASGLPDHIPDSALEKVYQDEQQNSFVRKVLEDIDGSIPHL